MGAATTEARPPGNAGLIVTLGVLTVLAAVGGGVVGKLVVARLHAVPAPKTEATLKASPYAGDVEVKELPPVVTNLAAPETARVRLQVAIVYTKKSVENPGVLVARISDDIIAYMKTLSLAQLQGASGLQSLREDLNERAAVRSDGKVREVIIEALVTQ